MNTKQLSRMLGALALIAMLFSALALNDIAHSNEPSSAISSVTCTRAVLSGRVIIHGVTFSEFINV